MFESKFIKSKGKPVRYKDNIIHMIDRLRLVDAPVIRVAIESTNSDWRQGLLLSTSGDFIHEDCRYPKSIVLWEDTMPPAVEYRIESNDGFLQIKNVWDTGDGTMHSWHNGAAMIIEEHGDMRRYFCNDGFPDDDFDDIIFTIHMPEDG